MRITFISPKFHNVWEPLGPAYIKAYCDKNLIKEHEWNFFHGNFDSEKDMIACAVQSSVVAFSCTTSTFRNGYEIAKRIKEINKDVLIVFGGWHPTTALIDADKVIDVVIYMEGEVPFYRLLKDFHRDFVDTILVSKPLPFDELPWPDRQFIHQERFLDLCEEMCGERIISFQSRRGCMMNCTMCGENCMSGNGEVRVRDSDDLLDEIEFMFDKYNATMFKFVDATWSYPKSAAKEFCAKKILRNGFKWEGMVHASYLDKDLMNLMMHSNCVQMNVGCESGSQRVLNSMKKGTTVQQIKKVFKWGKDLGINMRAFFMLGLEESIEEIEMTKQLIRDIKPDVLGVSILCPYPGTKYYRDEFKDMDWSKVDEYNSFWETQSFTKERFEQIQKDIYTEFEDVVVHHQKE
jgi:anaerobic magnesium-protoporphyrin IX monomethyl ester cyclase